MLYYKMDNSKLGEPRLKPSLLSGNIFIENHLIPESHPNPVLYDPLLGFSRARMRFLTDSYLQDREKVSAVACKH